MVDLNETHDPALRSWVESANAVGCDFPIQNLPYGVFRPVGGSQPWRTGVAIGDRIIDLGALAALHILQGEAAQALALAADSTLNRFMGAGPRVWSTLRRALSRLLAQGHPKAATLALVLIPQADCEMTLPARIGDYTDMYTSVHHASNIGKLFRPDNPLTPNFKWLPIGYHGRASSIGVSGQRFARPRGQILPPGSTEPIFSACRRLDYELELGIWIGPGNELGEPVALDEAESHVFGLCLLNDWSARDVQTWEYQPLGPFLAKNFATTISPWIVTTEALAPFRCPWTRDAADPQPLPYLESTANRVAGGFDVRIEAWLQTSRMRTQGSEGVRLSHSSFSHAYWSVAQMIAHHTVGGCNLQPGDLVGSGTQSGPTPSEAAALIEITAGGKNPLSLPDGETRTFLEDGDAVTLRAWCEAPGRVRIGFGACRGEVLPARG